MKKFKVGDKVRIKKGLVCGGDGRGYINPSMVAMGGQTYTLERASIGLYQWTINGYQWLEDWLEPDGPETTAEQIAALRATMKADEEAYTAKREANQKALDELLALPPSAGDVFWNPKTGVKTKSTIMAVVDNQIWYKNSCALSYVVEINHFTKIEYERYVP